MDKKTTALVATIATAVFCGCPGLLSLGVGGMMALVGLIPGAEIDIFGSSDPSSAIAMGIGMLCGGIVLIAIPIVVGVLTLRKPKPAVVENIDEPLPPAS